MGWTPPSKFIVILTFLTMVFGIFIFIDLYMGIWAGLLPAFDLFGYNGWLVLALILFFLTWFLFFLAIKLKGL
ncbi:MAG: hypothetical protein ACW98X_14125 [Promethearchaeota archaeon]